MSFKTYGYTCLTPRESVLISLECSLGIFQSSPGDFNMQQMSRAAGLPSSPLPTASQITRLTIHSDLTYLGLWVGNLWSGLPRLSQELQIEGSQMLPEDIFLAPNSVSKNIYIFLFC